MTVAIESTPAIPTQQNAAPTNGATVTISETKNNVDLWLTAAGALASVTVTLPNGPIGQVVTIGSSQTITLLNINGATQILGALNTLNSGDAFQLKRFSATTWARLI